MVLGGGKKSKIDKICLVNLFYIESLNNNLKLQNKITNSIQIKKIENDIPKINSESISLTLPILSEFLSIIDIIITGNIIEITPKI
jgi:hypothetical protein